MELIDRHAERHLLGQFVAAVRAGESRALVVSGEAGVGKTALLDHLAGNAPGFRVVRTAGYQSEMERRRYVSGEKSLPGCQTLG
jgi:predicted ATPase